MLFRNSFGVLDVWGVFVRLLLVLRFVSIRDCFGLVGRPFPSALGVDSGPGEGGSEGIRGAPKPYTNIYIFIAIQTSTTITFIIGPVGPTAPPT